MPTPRLAQLTRVGAVAAILLFGLSFGPFAGWSRLAAASVDVMVNLTDVRQAIDGFGASDAWSDNGLPVFTDAEMDLFFSQQSGIGLSFLRLNIKPSGANSTSFSIAQRAAARGARVWAAPWSAPSAWKDNGTTSYGGHLCAAPGQGVCIANNYGDWATRLAGFANTLKANGVDLYALSVQNEPDWSAPYSSMLYTDQEMVDFVKTLGPQLAALNPRPRLMVGEYANWGNIWSLASAIESDATAASYTDLFATHQYSGTSAYQGAHSRPLWQTEMSAFDSFDPGIDNAIGVADWIHDALTSGNVNAWHYWWLRGLNDDNEGLIGNAADPYAMTKRVFVMGNFSKFIRPGWVRVGTSGAAVDMNTLAFRNPATGEFAVVVINHGGTTALTIGTSGTFQSSITPHQTYDDSSGDFTIGAHGNLEPQASIGANGLNAFTATVPHGVTTFVGLASTSQTTTPPGAFNRSSPVNGASGQSPSLTLSWGAAPGASTYEYCLDTSNDGACSGWTSTGSSTSAMATGLAEGTTYFWHVRATNAGGTTYADGSSAAFWNFTTLTTPPGSFGRSLPANGVTGQSTNVTLTWGGSSGASTYEYCLDTTNDNACSAWTSAGSSTSAVVSGLAQGTTYYWHARAKNAGGTTYANGSSTAFWNFTTLSTPPGSFGRSLPANGATGQSINVTLTWGAASGASAYEYCLDTTNDNACSAWTSVGSSTSAVVSGLAQGTTYYWHTRAKNAGGTTYANGSSTVFWSFTTETAGPAAFGKLLSSNGATGQSTKSLALSWGASTGASSYEYCLGTSLNNCTWTSTGTSRTAKVNLSSARTYYWQVRAKNASGTTTADSSSWWSFRTR